LHHGYGSTNSAGNKVMGARSIGFLLNLVLVLAIGSVIDLAQAQSGNRGDGHAEHHDMYKDWEQPDVGGSCCNAQSADDPAGDCRPTTAYIGDDGRWHARIGPGPEDFATVPPNKILHRAVDGRCHICEQLGTVICFQPCDPKI
jgi:hypothetical protein